jgi:hypothetical protein
MWTRLVAGAVAHDINNLTQGLFDVIALSTAPDTSPEARTRYEELAREGIKELGDLGRTLRTLADAEPGAEPQRLDLACAEAVASVQPSAGRSLLPVAPAGPILVTGSRAALILAISGFVRYAVAASAPGASIGIAAGIEGGEAFVVVDAPTAPTRVPAEATLFSLMSGAERRFASDAGLVVAGAAIALTGGDVRVGPSGGAASGGAGLRFRLSFRRVEPRRE